jgi:hypothetical protein
MNRFRAQKIVEAREAKQALIGSVLDAVEAVRQATGRGCYAALGVTLGDIRRAKPKELREMLDRARGLLPAEAAA